MRCEAQIREGISVKAIVFRLGAVERPWTQCINDATIEVDVEGQGKMLMCDDCLPHFKKYATLPWTMRKLQ